MQFHNKKFSFYGTFNKSTGIETMAVYIHCRNSRLQLIGNTTFSQAGLIDSSPIKTEYKDEVSSCLSEQLKTEGVNNPIVIR